MVVAPMIVGLVCARANSEGLPGKNLLKLGGTGLVEIAYRKALDCPLIDRLAISTDLAPYFAAPGDRNLCEFIPRPPELAGPRVPKWDVWRHAVAEIEKQAGVTVTAIVDIDVTRPLTTVADITGTIEAWGNRPQGWPVAAAWRAQATPECDVFVDGDTQIWPAGGMAETTLNRQEVPEYLGYGGIYAIGRDELFRRSGLWQYGVHYHEIPRAHCFDIDDALDWEIVQDQWARQIAHPMSDLRGCHNEFAQTGGWK
jgi:CMP-N-acetylneuraminic acid synthetase